MTTYEPGGSVPPAASSDDVEQLRLIAIFHYVVAGIAALVSLLPAIYLVLGLALVSGRLGPPDEGARIVGGIMIGCATFFIAIGLTFAALVAFAGRSLQQRRRYTFCLVMGALLCPVFPFGTLLGVFTLVVLVRPPVKALFAPGGGAAPAAPRG